MSQEPNLRKSQLISTYGPGSLLDLPKKSVIVGSLDNWKWEGGKYTPIKEPRLSRRVSRILNREHIELRTPPHHIETNSGNSTQKVSCFVFPEWFMTSQLFSDDDSRFKYRFLVNIRQSENGKGEQIRREGKNYDLIPARFVQCCPKGHISDIDWIKFVHSGANSGCTNEIKMEERGTTGDFSDIYVKCMCGKERQLREAALFNEQTLGFCDGLMPWLGSTYKIENCREPNRLLTRTASNAYFPQKLSVISIRDESKSELQGLVELNFKDFFPEKPTKESIQTMYSVPLFKAKFKDFNVDQIWEAYVSLQNNEDSLPIKLFEFIALTSQKDQLGSEKPDGDFYARNFWKEGWNSNSFMKKIKKVVLVHRLKEVTALIGFTRLAPISKDINGEYADGVELAPLGEELSWVPAVENNGEGIFIQFKKEELEAWMRLPQVAQRYDDLSTSFEFWSRNSFQKKFMLDAPFILMHSIAHMLITTISLDCGYSSSSIRERIYYDPEIGGGILLYTGTSDSEGTLGGLVELGKNIDQIIERAIINNELCSNDPVCSYKDLKSVHTHHDLSGSSCHGCLFISETSCEMMNEFLDRSLVVQTIANNGCEFFRLEK